MEDKKLKIGEVSRRLDVAVETIRMYEREGLIIVAKTKSGQRFYSEDDLHWLNCIRRLIKEQGLNIEGIRRLLSLIPCWQIKPCSQKDRAECPAFKGSIKPCWMIKSDLKGDCRSSDCRQCHVYLNAHECTNLKGLLQKYTQIKNNPV